MVDSRAKGKRGERAWAAFLKAEGFDARRGAQHRGGKDSPDVICDGLAGLHFEVKVGKAPRVFDAVEQAVRDAGEKTPVVAMKRDRWPWLVVMKAEDWIKWVREVEG